MTKHRVALAFTLCLGSSDLSAQVPARNRVNDAAINAAIGGVVGAAWAAMRGASVLKGAGQGVTGGLIISGGRQTAASTFQEAGLLGRELSAAGVSLVASAGQPAMTFRFPFGPLSVQYANQAFDWRINVADCAIAAVVALTPHAQLDLPLSLSAGAPVFRSRGFDIAGTDNSDARGLTYGAVIWLKRRPFEPDDRVRQVLGHESVHVTQEDFVQNALALPVESAALRRAPWGKVFVRHFDLGLLGDASALALAHFIPYRSQPWEREAYGLESR
jgi:hypothetical protein